MKKKNRMYKEKKDEEQGKHNSGLFFCPFFCSELYANKALVDVSCFMHPFIKGP